MIKKILLYMPKLLLSISYAISVQKKGALLDQNRLHFLLQRIQKHLLSPRRNGRLDLIKRAIASYYLQPGDQVVDVGAHVGGYTLFYADLVGPSGKVYSYEAHPLIFKKLQERFQQTPQVTAINCAVSNTSNRKLQMRIYPNEITHECATVEKALMDAERMPGETALIEVECQSLDLLQNSPIRLIKIDVEGHEHAVIDGALHLLNKHKPILIFEYGYIPNKFEPTTISQIEQLGYNAYDCTTLKRVSPGYVALEVTDLVAVPREKAAELENLFKVL